MAKSANLVSTRNFNPIFNPSRHLAAKAKTIRLPPQIQISNNASASTKGKEFHSPPIGKTCRAPRRLITVSTSDGKWHGDWTCDYVLSLQDLQLQDLVEIEDRNKNARVLVNLIIQKHASFGLSVDGRIMTSFVRKCSNCSSPYWRQIDAKFEVWILLASRDCCKIQLPEIGGDPSVIYVKPGYEADLDSLVQDTIRLSTSVKDTCCELCEKSEATVQYTAGNNRSSIDKRWSRLLELKKASKE